MARRKKKTRRSRALVLGYLEQVSSKIFSEFPRQLTDLVGRQHGVYALYKKKKLYYVGLASNLRGRIKQHLKDKHAGKWDKFSIYLVRKADHIKELESIIMRISDPAGNAARGRLPRAENLKSDLLKRLKAEQERQLHSLVGGRQKKEVKVKKAGKVARTTRGAKRALAPYIQKGFRIRGEHNGKLVRAAVYGNGTIKFDGKLYTTPSGAAKAACKRTTNGWLFWSYKVKNGVWEKLINLKK